LRRAHVALPEATFADQAVRDEESPADVLEPAGPLRGTLFGDLVHEVLEMVSFADVGAAAAATALLEPGPVRAVLDNVFSHHENVLSAALVRAEDRNQALLQVAQVTWQALHTPLAELGCRLADIPAADRLHECEFYFPEQCTEFRLLVPPRDGFLTGFMDLVVRKDGRYFLPDWKTNDLRGDYSAAALARCMADSDYHRQYLLYTVGLCRWLAKRVPGFDYGRHFGGVYYLFVRGMSPAAPGDGVFFHKPESRELDLERILNP